MSDVFFPVICLNLVLLIELLVTTVKLCFQSEVMLHFATTFLHERNQQTHSCLIQTCNGFFCVCHRPFYNLSSHKMHTHLGNRIRVSLLCLCFSSAEKCLVVLRSVIGGKSPIWSQVLLNSDRITNVT